MLDTLTRIIWDKGNTTEDEQWKLVGLKNMPTGVWEVFREERYNLTYTLVDEIMKFKKMPRAVEENFDG